MKVTTAALLFASSYALPPAPLSAQEWGKLECAVVQEFFNLSIEQRHRLQSDRQLLMMALRGTNAETFERIEDQLVAEPGEVTTGSLEDGATQRMEALLSDRCPTG